MPTERFRVPRTKLNPPRLMPGWISRPRLLDQLDQLLEKPLALISAPAGFGKTILMAQWLDRCPLPKAWLQLDENDHDIPIFMSGLVAALRLLFPGCLQKTTALLHAQRSVPQVIWKNTLIGDLEELEDSPFVLALDDFHLIANPSIDLLLAEVLRTEPQSLHLMLAARHSPSLSFSRLKVEERVVEIKTADLRFLDSEALAYMHQASRVPLSDAAINQLVEKTEGWAAGMTLAAISLRKEIQPEDLIAHLDGTDRHLNDYLLDQVFNNQPEKIRDFLLKTATFDRFSAPMLQVVLESEQSEAEIQSLLEQIEDAQLFLIPLDTQRYWYRYHHLFRQMLLSRQRISCHSDQITIHHQRAAAWLFEHGQADEALGHLLTVRAWGQAAQLVESQFCSLLNSEDFLGIKRRLGYFSDDFIATRPGLLLMQAWLAHLSLRLAQMDGLTARIQDLLDAGEFQSESSETKVPSNGFEIIPRRTVQAHVWALESVILYYSNQGSQAISLSRQAVDFLPEIWMFARGTAMIYLGLSMVMEGQYHQMVELFKQAYEGLKEPGTTYGARLLFTLAANHLLHGELELCRQTAEQLVRNALAFNLVLMQGWGYYLLGRIYQEWNQLEFAARYYQLVVDQRFTSNLFCSLESVQGYVFVLHILGRHESAQKSLDSIQQLFGDQMTAMTQPVMALTAWLKLQHGNRIEALRWADSFYNPVSEQAIIWYHIPQIYKLKILMDTGRSEDSKIVDQLLDEIQQAAERTHNTFTLLRVLSIRAVWLARQGESAAAKQILIRALKLGRPGGVIHSFVIRGPEMYQLLRAIPSQLQDEPGLKEYVNALVDEFTKHFDPQALPPRLNEVKTLLTERELEVLELLAERLSINEISARLFISPSTVQQHAHHIYRKLNAANKRQAVARAAELGILTSQR